MDFLNFLCLSLYVCLSACLPVCPSVCLMVVSFFSGPGSLLWTYLTPSVSVYLCLSFCLSDDGEFVQWARFSSVDFLDSVCLCLVFLDSVCLCLSVCLMVVSLFSGSGSLLWTFLALSVSACLSVRLSFCLSDDGEFVQWARFSSLDLLDSLCLCLPLSVFLPV